MYWANLQSGLFPILIILVIFGGGALLERGQPAESGQPPRNARFNVLYGVVSAGLRFGLTPALGILVTVLINGFAGGWIALPGHGWPLVGSVILYVLVIDFLEFAFHRAQHVVPFLWAMHSFHHSDRAVNVSTAVRNYWLELPIKILFVYPVAAILFRVPAAVLAIYAGTTVWHSINHLNIRWRLPIPWFVLNNPQFHRIHHSILPEHRDKNFSPYFPIWDVIGGTAHAPKPDEYPPTGLDEEPAIITFADAILWPWRHRLRKRSGLTASVAG
jgi:sterol desaturase/sphingolipid hydroxylase (fatty acid hydroxylase superfamily)